MLEGAHGFEADVVVVVGEDPADIAEVGRVEESGRMLLKPDAKCMYAFGADGRVEITIPVNEDAEEESV